MFSHNANVDNSGRMNVNATANQSFWGNGPVGYVIALCKSFPKVSITDSCLGRQCRLT